MLRKSHVVSLATGLAVALLAVLGAQGSMDPMDERGDAEIVIVRQGSDAANSVLATVDALEDRLIAEGFEVELVDGPVSNPRAFLAERPGASHLITDLKPHEEQEVSATLYTRGAVTPRRFGAASVETLVARLRAFLISRQAVDMRLAMADESADPYDRALREGLRLMDDTETAEAAVAAFEEAARLRPSDPAPHLNLALTHKRLGQHDQRRRHVAAGLELDPDNLALRNEKALLRIMDGDLTGAVVILEGLPQDDAVVLWNLAYVYGQMEQMDRAKTYFQRVAELQADQRLSVVANKRLDELELKERRLASVRTGLWAALAGLGSILVIAMIMLIVRRLNRQTREAEELSPGDRLAVRVQVGLAVVSGLFSIATVVLSNVMSGP